MWWCKNQCCVLYAFNVKSQDVFQNGIKINNIHEHKFKLYIMSSLNLQPVYITLLPQLSHYLSYMSSPDFQASSKLVCYRKCATISQIVGKLLKNNNCAADQFKNTPKLVLLLWLQIIFVYFVFPQCLTPPNCFLSLRLCSGTQLCPVFGKFWEKQAEMDVTIYFTASDTSMVFRYLWS